MNPALHDLLLRCDVKDAWEHPPGADWSRAVAEIERLQPALEAALGVSLELDKDVQDASFFADLSLLVQDPKIGANYWFSKLYTVWGDNWERYRHADAKAVLREAGFTYVPHADLDEPYDGVNTPYEPGLTWWVRYFDYL